MTDKRIGFIGTGAITEAMVRGLLSDRPYASAIHVTPRSENVSARLATEFEAVTIAKDNQAVVDESNVVFLAIRPQIAERVVRELSFRSNQSVVSLVPATQRETLLEWIDCDVHLVQAIPLPFVADRQGVTALYPDDPETTALFNALGTAIPCGTRKEYDLLAAASALMSTYFGIMDFATSWLVENGLDGEKAQAYIAPLFSSLSQRAMRPDSGPFGDLSREFATKGGLNEQVLVDFEKGGGADALHSALDAVLARIENRNR